MSFSFEKNKCFLLGTNLGRGVLGLDSRERIFPLLPFTRFLDVSLDLAPPIVLFGDRSLKLSSKLNISIGLMFFWSVPLFFLEIMLAIALNVHNLPIN